MKEQYGGAESAGGPEGHQRTCYSVRFTLRSADQQTGWLVQWPWGDQAQSPRHQRRTNIIFRCVGAHRSRDCVGTERDAILSVDCRQVREGIELDRHYAFLYW